MQDAEIKDYLFYLFRNIENMIVPPRKSHFCRQKLNSSCKETANAAAVVGLCTSVCVGPLLLRIWRSDFQDST
jgi:hypothetical protein